MLVELRVENLGIIADLLLARAGMTVITGETGAGKTLIVDALDLLCGGRADAALVRDGADEARVEGRFVDGDDEVVLARVIPAVGRTAATSTGSSRPLPSSASAVAARRPARPARAPVAARAGRATRAARSLCGRPRGGRARGVLAARARAGGASTKSSRRSVATTTSRARTIDLLRYELDEIDAAEIEDADEDDAARRGGGDPRRRGSAPRSARRPRRRARRPALDALGAAIAAIDRGARRSPRSRERLRALQIETAEAVHDVRIAAEQIVADPERLGDRAAATRPGCASSCASTGRRSPRSRRTRIEIARRAWTELEGHDARAAALEVERGRRRPGRRGGRGGALEPRGRPRRAPLATAVEARLRELAMPAATSRLKSSRAISPPRARTAPTT